MKEGNILLGLEINSIILLVVAGFGAGIVTGLAGASAATIVTPLLVAFTPISAYIAITISLITDVFASFFSFLTYNKNGNINIDDGKFLSISACIGAFIGSYLSSLIDTNTLGSLGGFMTLTLGINFLNKGIKLHKNPDMQKEVKPVKLSKYNPALTSTILGLLLGLVCGFVGAGGGLMILQVLTFVLKYDTKTAIGTSVLIMTFTALTGGISHFTHMGDVNVLYLSIAIAITSVSAIIGAKIAATFANKTSESNLLMLVGFTFIATTASMVIAQIF